MTKEELTSKLIGTKYTQTMRNALFMVLVDGASQSHAAKTVGVSRSGVNLAVKKLK